MIGVDLRNQLPVALGLSQAGTEPLGEHDLNDSVGAFIRYYQTFPCDSDQRPEDGDGREETDEERPGADHSDVGTIEDWRFLTSCGYPVKGQAAFPIAGLDAGPPPLILNLAGNIPVSDSDATTIGRILPHPFGPVLTPTRPAGFPTSPWVSATVDAASEAWAAQHLVEELHPRFVSAFKKADRSSFACPSAYLSLFLASTDRNHFVQLYAAFLDGVDSGDTQEPAPGPEPRPGEDKKPIGWNLREFLTVADPTQEADELIHRPQLPRPKQFQMLDGVFVQGRKLDDRYAEYRKIVTNPALILGPETDLAVYQSVVCARGETEAELLKKRKLLEAIEVGDDQQLKKVYQSLFGYGMTEESARARLQDSLHIGMGGAAGELSEDQVTAVADRRDQLIAELVGQHNDCKNRQGENCDEIIRQGAETLERLGSFLALAEPNGCTGVPDIDEGVHEACNRHDEAYEQGGTEADRKEADVQLKKDIEDAGHPVVAAIYYAGVRVFGSSFFNYHD